MRKTLSILAAACLVSVSLAAQEPATPGQNPERQAPPAPRPAPSAPTQTGAATADASKKITLSGCIERQTGAQAATMPFSLTNSAAAGSAPVGTTGAAPAAAIAKTYRLDATESMVSGHVGHKVELTGTVEDQPRASATASPTGAAASASAGAGASAPTFKVESLKMVAATCP